MAKIQVKCFECGGLFLKRRGDVNRSNKINRPHFCDKECRVENIRNGSKSDYYKNYKYPIVNYCGCRRDELSPFRVFVIRSKAKDRTKLYGTSTLSAEYLKKIWKQQNGKCSYTKLQMVLPKNTKDYYKTHSLKKARGSDRTRWGQTWKPADRRRKNPYGKAARPIGQE